MYSRIVILAYVIFGFAATCPAEVQSDWQSVVKDELRRVDPESDGMIYPLSTNMGHMTSFSIPPKIAEVLESRRPEELLPFLSELREHAAKYSVQSIILGHCILILDKGLHGRPDTVRLGVAPNMRQIPVFTYELPY